MNNKSSFERYNVILIILFFVIPILALNLSYYSLSKRHNDLLAKEQSKKAFNEVETLASESDFSNEFSMHYRSFFNEIINAVDSKIVDKVDFSNRLEQKAGKIFKSPFPEYNLYVFKLSEANPEDSELIFCKGSLKSGKKALCKAFSVLYSVNINLIGINEAKNNKFIKSLIGKYSSVDVVANEMRGLPTHTNGIHNFSWFIWDYFVGNNKDVYGSILVCDDITDYAEKGRLLALEELKARRYATGAFIPVYKDFGKSNILPPLDKSGTFRTFAEKLIIKEEKDYSKWIKEPLPQAVPLGNYTAFTFLERGSSHIAVILVKSLKGFAFPKWLIVVNVLSFLVFFEILFYGIIFGSWPKISLSVRFTLSYLLASVLPVSMLCVTAYSYLLEYQNTSIDQASNELMIDLKGIDGAKMETVKEYRATFSKAIKDSRFIELIQDKGIEDRLVAKRVMDIFESSETGKKLPLLGVKILDEKGNGAIATTSSKIDVDAVIKTFLPPITNLLRKEMNLSISKTNDTEKDLANRAYLSLTGRSFDYDLNRLSGVPIFRKNGDFSSYFMFDLIRIDGKVKYMLFILWDDKALDDTIIKDYLRSKALSKKEHNFLAYRVKGQKVDYIGEKTRHASQQFIKDAPELAKKTYYRRKTTTIVDDKTITAVMPSFNFSQTVFIVWKDMFNINNDIDNRRTVFVIIIVFSLIILLICSIRSSAVFLKPVSALKDALNEVSNGNLNVGFKDNTKDELGQLSNEFSNMISELKEKERLSKLISDQAVLALQKKSNEMLNDTETFNGVALVSDIRNFTGMSEEYNPVVITELLNEHFAEMAKIISDNGGLIYKFIGDAIEAVFPEKDEYDESASERAFKAGCMMITKLAVINSRRKKKKLFPYKIGVGLCYGTLFSGTVGSLETRLDYSIIGDPLKKAAKFEALSIQSPQFPLVLGENIAEKIAEKGIAFEKIDSKGNDFNVYVLKEVSNYLKVDDSINSNELEKRENETNTDKIYSISNIFQKKERIKDFVLNSFIVFFIALFITIGVNTAYYTKFNDLKSHSDKECYRLEYQLECDDVLRSAFDALCFEFFEDIYKSLNSDENTLSFSRKIEKVAEKYERLNLPIPKYYICRFENNKKTNEILVKGFSPETTRLIDDYLLSLETGDSSEEKLMALMGKAARAFNMKSVHFRRSALASIDNENILVDSDKIYSKDHKKFIAYVFCGLPEKVDKSRFINYCTLLAGNNNYLAIKDKNEWYFSRSFPEKEKKYLQTSNDTDVENKGYYIKDIKINNENYKLYAISKELDSNNYSVIIIDSLAFVGYLVLFGLIMGIIRKRIFISGSSIASKLRLEISISALLPLLTVCFLYYLYINEEFNAKKSETISGLNRLIDDVESKEFYYNPLCENYFKNLPNSKKIKQFVNEINTTKGEERNQNVKKLSKYLYENVSGYNSKTHKSLNKKEYLYSIKEIILIGKDGWRASAVASENRNSRFTEKDIELSDFGKLISDVGKEILFSKDSKANKTNENNNDAVKGEMVTEALIKTLESVFGSEFCYKIINFPNNFIALGVSYSICGFYFSAYPNLLNPDYIIISLVLFDSCFVSDICNMKNDVVPYKNFIASGSIGDEYYCFYSAHPRVGESFFLYKADAFYNNPREDLKTVKELGLAASWITTSFLPVSKKVDLYGPHFLEARLGNYVTNNVYAALASEYPLRKMAEKNYIEFGCFIFLSLLMIFFITQSVINDLIAPIKRLIEGAVDASNGNYSFRTLFKRRDELGSLCESFDKMMKGLEEKQLMNRMVSKTALKVSANITDVDSKKINVVLLYITVPTFDLIMKNMPAYELFSRLRKQIADIAEIVIKNGGDIDKIMGEKMLIAFHVGDKNPEEVARLACWVAHEIESSRSNFFKVSVGVNYGQVISGFLGVGGKRDFTIIGDPVNVAARIAVLGEKLDKDNCLISETIYYYISKHIKANLYGEVELKGKSQPMKVYQLS